MSKKTNSRGSKEIKKVSIKRPSSGELFSKLRLTRWIIIKSIIFSLLLSLTLSYFINIGPISPQKFSVKKNIEVSKSIKPKNVNCKYIFQSEYIRGPETLLYNKERNSIFTGSRNGSIIELDVNSLRIKKVYSIYGIIYNDNNKLNCDGTFFTLPKCGRPLGMQFGITPSTRNILYVADGIFGIYSLDLDTEKITILGDGDEENEKIKNKKMYGNDLIVTQTGIYFSLSSTKFNDHEYLYDILEHTNNGKIMYYDFKTKRISEIVKNLYFSNGIQMIENKKILLVAEMSKMRIIKIDLKNKNKISVDKFIEYLPGYVDNIRIVEKNGIKQLLVPIPEQVTDSDEFFANHPNLRMMLSSIFNYPVIEKIVNFLSNDNSIFQYYNLEDGKHLETFNVPFKDLSISHVLHLQHLNTLYFGSDNGDHINACQLS